LGTRPDTGWTGYAPLQSVSFPSEGGLHPWVRLVIWLILIVLWMIVSMAVLRSKTGDSNDATSP
jgi:heme/copper-type cytochrome/quinol oxidase subunit 1